MKLRPGLPVLAEAEGAWAIVGKPPGLLVHRNAFAPKAVAALQIVRWQARARVFPIHRLDRAASGCLLFGLAQEGAGALQKGLMSPDTRKRYVALVRGYVPSRATVAVETPIKDENGVIKEAYSLVTCVASCEEPRCSVFIVEPRTGRHHQVRRHVRDLDHPIVNDSKHGDLRVNRLWRERGFSRLGLHALSLSLPGPDGPIAAVCPLFEDMATALRGLTLWDEAVAAVPELGLPPLPVGIPTPGSVEDDDPGDVLDEDA